MPKFYCTQCGQQIDTADELTGTHVACPSCRAQITVPELAICNRSELSGPALSSPKEIEPDEGMSSLVGALPSYLQKHLKNLEEMEHAETEEERKHATKHKRLLLSYPEDIRAFGYSKILTVKLLSGCGLFFSFLLLGPFIPSGILGLGLISGPFIIIIRAVKETNSCRRLGITSTCPMWAYMKIDVIITCLFIVSIGIITVIGGKF